MEQGEEEEEFKKKIKSASIRWRSFLSFSFIKKINQQKKQNKQIPVKRVLLFAQQDIASWWWANQKRIKQSTNVDGTSELGIVPMANETKLAVVLYVIIIVNKKEISHQRLSTIK